MGVSLNKWLMPYDDDHDGRVDEDPPEALDGDGAITQSVGKDSNGS